MGVLYILYESASGYGLFEQVKCDEIGVGFEEVQAAIVDLQRFSKIMKLISFRPFLSAENALENINAISEGEMTQDLHDFLEANIPKPKEGKKSKITLGVVDPKIGNVITETMKTKCVSDKLAKELIRGIRLHFDRFIKGLEAGDLAQARLGLGHSYSRSKVKFNVHRVDNMIVQSINLLDQLDKDLNTFSMRINEWYSWHFPELKAIVTDHHKFALCTKLIKDKKNMTEETVAQLEEILEDADAAKQIFAAAKMSMGTDISPIDMLNIEHFASRVIGLGKFRKNLHDYLCAKMNSCAPNLSALIGEMVGARLISHAGSLTSLAKYPASTVQILGAEKALFRALKTKGNTPKYGLIFHSSFIGRAKPKNKGRISRYLANKASLASRIDCFSEVRTNTFGNKLRDQVEERLEFYSTGKAPRKNIDVMQEAMKLVEAEMEAEDDAEAAGAESRALPNDGNEKKKKKDKKSKKKKAAEEPTEADAKADKKSKKKKKREAEAAAADDEEPPKKKKKKKTNKKE